MFVISQIGDFPRFLTSESFKYADKISSKNIRSTHDVFGVLMTLNKHPSQNCLMLHELQNISNFDGRNCDVNNYIVKFKKNW